MSTPQELLTHRVPEPRHTLRYGTHEQQVADVWLPDSEPFAVVLFLHGGFWREAHDRHYTDPFVHALARTGYVAVNVEYRRIGGAGGNPQTFDDIALAIDELPEIARSACGLPADKPVILAGHSAGGHLALWASARHLLTASSPWHTPNPVQADGILALAAVTSIASALADGIGENAAAELLAEEDNLDRIDPGRIGAGPAATALVHGKLDHRVPFGYSTVHQRMLEEAGTPVRLDVLSNAGHFEIIDPFSSAWSTVLADLNWLVSRS
ncbi:alpha/beta hydrolase family protein [Haloactinomyces albus]|uniref:Acetyl esterase/lipase n=1 Tax=Haloactinomyces albus TaxID=1352928 RepID=A0AAE3ZIK8_9ACTN|nr:alpha/beta hydrolase [Haloactinomyces albus]MDR7303569.1 acetyl esterase/lipase [Haloactinomyces albus]